MAERKVEFKFDIDDEVVTKFGDPGVVVMLGYDDGGIQYCVKTDKGSEWYKEKLVAAPGMFNKNG